MDLAKELKVAQIWARKSGDIARAMQGNLAVTHKSNGEGPVSDADLTIDSYICESIFKEFPKDLIVSEESFVGPFADPPNKRTWFVDPIDGTATYIRGKTDYSVMIGLAIDGIPRLGVVYQPARDILWRGLNLAHDDHGCAERCEENSCQKIHSQKSKTDIYGLNMAVSRHHPSKKQAALMQQINPQELIYRSSMGLKAMAVIDREADIYVAWSKSIKKWDTCAPCAIVSASGGFMGSIDGSPLDFAGSHKHSRPILAANHQPSDNLLSTIKKIALEN